MKLYSIRDWNEHFEKAQTRKVGKIQWVPLPVKHDGLTYRRLMATPNGLTIYGAWVLIVQVAAKCDHRGTLADEHGPLTAEAIALKTGAPEASIQEALEVLSGPRIGWLMVSDYQPGGSTAHHDTSELPAAEFRAETEPPQQMQAVGSAIPAPAISLELHDKTGQDKTGQDSIGQDNGASRAGRSVVAESLPALTRKQLLAYAEDPVAGAGINHPQRWASARLKDHAADDEVRDWLAGKPKEKQREKSGGNRAGDRTEGRSGAVRRSAAGTVKAPDSEV